MARILFILIFLTAGHISYAQSSATKTGSAQEKKNQVVDRHCACPEFKWNGNFFQLNDIANSTMDLEIRFHYTAKNYAKSVLVLKKNHGIYDAKFYVRQMRLPPLSSGDSITKYGKWEKYPYYKFQLDTSNLKEVIQRFLDSHILTLPNQREVLDRIYMAFYLVEIKDRQKVRSYHFSAPIDPKPEEFPNIKELKDYAQLAQLFHSVISEEVKVFKDHISRLPNDLTSVEDD